MPVSKIKGGSEPVPVSQEILLQGNFVAATIGNIVAPFNVATKFPRKFCFRQEILLHDVATYSNCL